MQGVVSATAHGIAQGVLFTMWLNSLKTIAALLIAAALLTTGTTSLLTSAALRQGLRLGQPLRRMLRIRRHRLQDRNR